MTIIEINKRLYTVPTCWNELTRRQLLDVMKIIYSPLLFTIEAAYLKLLKTITGMGWYHFFSAPITELEEYLYLVDFLFKENELVKQVIPVYKNMYGPADDFNNLIMAEFIFTEDIYLKFCDSKKEDINLLDQLVAILYRPTKKAYDHKLNKDGDPRMPFNENICIYNAKKCVRRWPANVKHAILHWYQGCQQKLINEIKEFSTGDEGDPAKYGLLSVMRSIAEKGIHGDFEKVEKMYVRMWVMELSEMSEETKRIKASIKS